MTTEELGTDGLERDRKRIRQEGEELQKRRNALEQDTICVAPKLWLQQVVAKAHISQAVIHS
ncbi:MAG: hypothetical protein Q7J98_00410 [Kiritimatiellia bacterium]|nr:hypothetical protein [Kiritimatiellia bacterium]